MRTAILCLACAVAVPAFAQSPTSSDVATGSMSNKSDSMSQMQQSVRMELEALRALVSAQPSSGQPSSGGGTSGGSQQQQQQQQSFKKLESDLNRAQQHLDGGKVSDAYTTIHQTLNTNKNAVMTAVQQAPADASRKFVDSWAGALQKRIDEIRSMSATPSAEVQSNIDSAMRLRSEAQRANSQGSTQEAFQQLTQASSQLDQAVKAMSQTPASDPYRQQNPSRDPLMPQTPTGGGGPMK